MNLILFTIFEEFPIPNHSPPLRIDEFENGGRLVVVCWNVRIFRLNASQLHAQSFIHI